MVAVYATPVAVRPAPSYRARSVGKILLAVLAALGAVILIRGVVSAVRDEDVAEPAMQFSSAVDVCEESWNVAMRSLREYASDDVLGPRLRAAAAGAEEHDVAVAQALRDAADAGSANESSDAFVRFIRRCMGLGWSGPTEAELAEIVSTPRPRS